MDIDFGDLDFSFDNISEDSKIEKPKPAAPDPTEEKHIAVSHRLGHRSITRKIASEKALEDSLPWHFHEGDSFHCFSFGDVDSFTFLRMVMRQQPIKYVAISTWCMAGEDIKELQQWYFRSMLGRVDLFVGEIFRGSYPEVYELAKRFLKDCGGRLCVFKNHSKVMAIKGEYFDCLIESSANVNTNPRSENTVITVDSSLVDYYIKLFGEIKPFNDDYGAEPYQIEELKNDTRD